MQRKLDQFDEDARKSVWFSRKGKKHRSSMNNIINEMLGSARLLHCVQVPRSRQKFFSLSPQAIAVKSTRNDLVAISLSVRTHSFVHFDIPLHFSQPLFLHTLTLRAVSRLALFDILFMSHFRYFDVLFFMLQFINFSHEHLHKLVIETNESEQKR